MYYIHIQFNIINVSPFNCFFYTYKKSILSDYLVIFNMDCGYKKRFVHLKTKMFQVMEKNTYHIKDTARNFIIHISKAQFSIVFIALDVARQKAYLLNVA